MPKPLVVLLALPLISAAAPAEDYAEPYRILQQANVALDASLAASAYASGATLRFDYPGQVAETFQGREAIQASYVRTFGQVDPGTPIHLQFRFRPPGLTSDDQVGVYRIDARAGGRPITLYGSFKVRLVRQPDGWRFAEDHGTPATAADFDELPTADIAPR